MNDVTTAQHHKVMNIGNNIPATFIGHYVNRNGITKLVWFINDKVAEFGNRVVETEKLFGGYHNTFSWDVTFDSHKDNLDASRVYCIDNLKGFVPAKGMSAPAPNAKTENFKILSQNSLKEVNEKGYTLSEQPYV